jgi:SAM-dependent methyltransferase
MTVGQSLRRMYHRLPSPPSTNYHLGQMDTDPLALLPPGSLVLDVGSGSARGRYAFVHGASEARRLRWIALDVECGEGVTVVADAHRLPFATDALDCIACVSTLEYLRDPRAAVAEMYRVLKPGGLLYLSAPFVFPHHPPPADLTRFSASGIRVLADRFDEIRTGYNRGPASTFCHILVHFLAVALAFNCRPLYGVLVDAFKWMFFWIKYLDRWIGRHDVAHVIHSGSFFFGRKPAHG